MTEAQDTYNAATVQNACEYARGLGNLAAICDALERNPESVDREGLQKLSKKTLRLFEELQPFLFPETKEVTY